MHASFDEVKKIIADQLCLECINFKPELESQEYSAARLEIGHARVVFRVAKITPTKVGQFVTLWKRIGNGPIMPFDAVDQIDFCMISVSSKDHFGLFIFPKSVLINKDIFSANGQGGKRAIRVYPSWDVTDSKQAKATQAWQLRYFIEISPDGFCDKDSLRKLLL